VRDYGLVVIGAHSGTWLEEDIVKNINKNILLVEPVPYNYNLLINNFSKYPNIEICKNAIFDSNEKKNFFFVKEDSIKKLKKHWASGIGSFNKDHILDHNSKRFRVTNEDIDEIIVEFITFDDLIKKYSIKKIDKLQIDVEGAEFNILNSIDFTKIDIGQIIFESKHFDGTFREGDKLKKIKKKLINFGFTLTQIDKENILAKKITFG